MSDKQIEYLEAIKKLSEIIKPHTPIQKNIADMIVELVNSIVNEEPENKPKPVNTGLSNTYGYVTSFEEDEKYYLHLDDYSTSMRVEISEELYTALDKEFNK